MSHSLRRAALAVGLAAAVIVAGWVSGRVVSGRMIATAPDAPGIVPPAGPPPSLAAVLGDVDAVEPISKIDGALKAAALGQTGAATDEHFVYVQSLAKLDLGRYGDFVHQFTWPAGEQVAMLYLSSGELLEVAALPGVFSIASLDYAREGRVATTPSRPDDPDNVRDLPEPLDPEALRALVHAAPAWAPIPPPPAAFGKAASAPSRDLAGRASDLGDAENRGVSGRGALDRGGAAAAPGTDGWWDVRHGHAAEEAWAMGYSGEGVSVAVLDYTVDFAHADLMGTWKVLPAGHPYAGWPQTFDPLAGYLAVQDKALPPERVMEKSTRTASNGMIELYQESNVVDREENGENKLTACFRPLVYRSAQQARVLAAESCDFVMPPTSKSRKIRFGHHPDTRLRALGAKPNADPSLATLGEWVGVIIVDEHTVGEYDTVYVDVDNDRDFTDEKPLTKSDPLAYRDIRMPAGPAGGSVAGMDGIPDLAGGLLYFISDGELPFPGAWVWGVDKPEDIAPAGTLIGIQWAQSDHGTLCASNIVSQGRIKVRPDQILEFRDLPGNHQPPSVNRGMAPDAGLVSVGSVYAAPAGTNGRAMFAPSWHYSIFGHDVQRGDDQIQVTSNSYGWSDDDLDNWDPDSRLIDYYVRTFNPETTFLFATGNGGPGYGTIAPPSPSVGIDVAASTQIGSTGFDSITDTTQITYGDVIPFSNRGPGAAASNGPDLAADGAYASGAIPINFFISTDGTDANGTWGGTSRSTPVAAGATALVYQAFKAREGRWPKWEEARAILMSGARYNGYDTLQVGAGVVDAADAVRIASGKHGVYATPAEWRAGDFHGQSYAAFANIINPGGQSATRITLHNPSDAPVTLRLGAQAPRRIGSYQEQVVTERPEEDGPGAVPDYLRAIDKSKIPAGTEMMVVRGIYPMAEFDLGSNFSIDNSYTPGVYQHTDIDGDGKLWEDRNGNGVVNYRPPGNAVVETSWDGGKGLLDGMHAPFTKVLAPEGLTALIAWYGPACNLTTPQGAHQMPEQDVREKIAVIEQTSSVAGQTTCNATVMVNNAQTEGAIGVIIVSSGAAKSALGGTATGVNIPAVMVDRRPGMKLRDLLRAGTEVTGKMLPRAMGRTKGIDGAVPIIYADSEIDQYEYVRLSYHSSTRNNWQIPVHHPLERWKDGLYVGLLHGTRSQAVTNTHVTLRYDFYAYKPWNAVQLSQTSVTIPAKGQATVDATLSVSDEAAPGAWQGAIFADYDRGAGDLPVPTGGGYELPNLRTVIPIHAAIAPAYDWHGALTMGGAPGRDDDAPYNNGAVFGTFNWGWRAESGDWRFFFVDAAEPPANTYWLFRTTWNDPNPRQADIDTRVLGPTVDRYSNPADPANTPGDERGDPTWYGPYTMGLIGRSTLSHRGSGQYNFVTSTGENEDWVLAPARAAGLHEIMLHNVLFSGTQFEMPFETTVGALRVAPSAVALRGQYCSAVELQSEIDMPGAVANAFGLSKPEVLTGVPTQTDPPTVPPTNPPSPVNAGFKRDIVLATDAPRFSLTLRGEADDNLNLYLMYDANRDGSFVWPGEAVGTSAGATSNEQITGSRPAGAYQIWVFGQTVNGTDSKFNLTIDIISGDSVKISPATLDLQAGVPARFEVCADIAKLTGEDGPLSGLVFLGPAKTTTLIQLPVTWERALPTIHLPMALNSEVLGAAPEEPAGPLLR